VSGSATSNVVAYTTATAGGRRVAAAGPQGWYRALADDDVRLGRTDPELDQSGNRGQPREEDGGLFREPSDRLY